MKFDLHKALALEDNFEIPHAAPFFVAKGEKGSNCFYITGPVAKKHLFKQVL